MPSLLTSEAALLVPSASMTKPASMLSTVPSELTSYLLEAVVGARVGVGVVVAVGAVMLLLSTISLGLPKPSTTFSLREPSRFARLTLPLEDSPVDFAPRSVNGDPHRDAQSRDEFRNAGAVKIRTVNGA